MTADEDQKPRGGGRHAGIQKNPEGATHCDECATPAVWTVDVGEGPALRCDRHKVEDDSECDALGLARTPWEPIRADSRHVGGMVGLVILVLGVLLCPGCGSRESADAGEVALYVIALGVLSVVVAWIGDAVRRAVRS